MTKKISTIFTNKQVESIIKRANGDFSDPEGNFVKFARPKIEEMIYLWNRPEFKKLLKKSLKRKRKVPENRKFALEDLLSMSEKEAPDEMTAKDFKEKYLRG